MPDDEESLITPAMQAIIGVETEPETIEISRELVYRLADALGDEAVKERLRSDDPNPSVPHWAVMTFQSRFRQQRVPDMPPRTIMAAEEMQVFAPLHVGDKLTIASQVADIQERIGGRVGHSVFVHHQWTYTNQDGKLVGRMRRTVSGFHQRHSGD